MKLIAIETFHKAQSKTKTGQCYRVSYNKCEANKTKMVNDM